MASVCLYLAMHQPLRLRRYGVFETEARYLDHELNAEVLRRVVRQSYNPALERLLELIRRHDGRFRVTLGVSGVLMEQLRTYTPEVVERLVDLSETGAVEFTAEPYYHSLASLFSDAEFKRQVEQHAAATERLFDQRPRVLTNTELIYTDGMARLLGTMDGFAGVLAEGAEPLLAGRTVHRLYRACGGDLRVMTRHSGLSDDLAFRFSDTRWDQHPLTASRFADWIERSVEAASGDFCGLFLDLDAFGARHPAESGIFEFLDRLPEAVLERGGLDFRTAGEAVEACNPGDRLEGVEPVSWADREHDLSAWLGNAMQRNAVRELYRLEESVKASGDTELLEAWRRLTVSDHAYYMATKRDEDAAVHRHFSPYASPYDAYINFMNVLDNLRSRVEA